MAYISTLPTERTGKYLRNIIHCVHDRYSNSIVGTYHTTSCWFSSALFDIGLVLGCLPDRGFDLLMLMMYKKRVLLGYPRYMPRSRNTFSIRSVLSVSGKNKMQLLIYTSLSLPRPLPLPLLLLLPLPLSGMVKQKPIVNPSATQLLPASDLPHSPECPPLLRRPLSLSHYLLLDPPPSPLSFSHSLFPIPPQVINHS